MRAPVKMALTDELWNLVRSAAETPMSKGAWNVKQLARRKKIPENGWENTNGRESGNAIWFEKLLPRFGFDDVPSIELVSAAQEIPWLTREQAFAICGPILRVKGKKKELEGSTTNSTKFEITGTTQGEQKTAKRATKARPIGRLGTTYPYTPSSYRVSLRLSQIVNPGEKEIDLFHSLALFVVFLRCLFAPKVANMRGGQASIFFSWAPERTRSRDG